MPPTTPRDPAARAPAPPWRGAREKGRRLCPYWPGSRGGKAIDPPPPGLSALGVPLDPPPRSYVAGRGACPPDRQVTGAWAPGCARLAAPGRGQRAGGSPSSRAGWPPHVRPTERQAPAVPDGSAGSRSGARRTLPASGVPSTASWHAAPDSDVAGGPAHHGHPPC